MSSAASTSSDKASKKPTGQGPQAAQEVKGPDKSGLFDKIAEQERCRVRYDKPGWLFWSREIQKIVDQEGD